MYCPKCGAQNSDESFKCSRCGNVLKVATAPSSDPIATLIPYKNAKALIAYYLAVFSLIPCIGSPLGIAALILGLQGLKEAQAHPEARGKVHALIGILTGGFFGLLYTVLILFGLFEAIFKK